MSGDVEDLLRKATDSLQAAHLLHREHYYDFAASRAYYTMFYVAEAFLLSKGLTFSSHSAVMAAFGKEFAKTGIVDPKFHRNLLKVEKLRNVGDYEIGPSLTDRQAAETLVIAEEFLQVARQFLAQV